MTTPPDDPIESLVTAAGTAAFPADIQERVEQLLQAGQSLEPAVRERFQRSSARGMRHLAQHRTSLESVLFSQRHALGQPVEALAAATELDPEVMRGVEHGETPIASQPPRVVGLWARNLGLDRQLVESALRVSLYEASEESTDEPNTRPEDMTGEAFITAVLQALTQDDDGPT